MKIKVAILVEQAIFRNGLKTLLNSTNNFEVIAEFKNKNQAIETLFSVNADVLIISDDSISIYSDLKLKGYKIPVLIFSEAKSKENHLKAFHLNASGIIFKDCDPSELFHSITKITEGEIYFTSEVSNYLIQSLYVKNIASKKNKINILTPREKQIIELIKEGYKSKKLQKYYFYLPEPLINIVLIL